MARLASLLPARLEIPEPLAEEELEDKRYLSINGLQTPAAALCLGHETEQGTLLLDSNIDAGTLSSPASFHANGFRIPV